jgi:hypothetical protein
VSPPGPGQGAALISVAPATSPEAAATSTLIQHLRSTVIPAAEHGTSLRVYVGGVTATNDDFATVIAPKLLISSGSSSSWGSCCSCWPSAACSSPRSRRS